MTRLTSTPRLKAKPEKRAERSPTFSEMEEISNRHAIRGLEEALKRRKLRARKDEED